MFSRAFKFHAYCLIFAGGFIIARTAADAAISREPVRLDDRKDSVLLSNGIIEAVISKRGSNITSVKYGKHQMVSSKKPVYYSMGGGSSYRQPDSAEFRVVKQTPEIAEVAFFQKWSPGAPQAVDIEVHYALKRGESGIHTYAILHHPADYPDSSVHEWRMVWGMPVTTGGEWLMEKIRVDRLRDWEMPSPADLAKAKRTSITEIVEITQGPRAGKFDCKYDFNLEYYSTGCWGHASDRNQVGAWIVLGSHEFFNDGPTKQDLSSASDLIHIHFGMNHYDGSATRLQAGREWRKIYGPFLLYCNHGGDADSLWEDARAKAASERRAWPCDWVDDESIYPKRDGRGTVVGKLSIRDALKPGLNASGSWIGLSQPGPGGNWQYESNGYQYWIKADAGGSFSIPNVRPGAYTLSAFTDGAVGEFEKTGVVVKPGSNFVGDLEWNVPHVGKSIAWEIGVPDRRAGEFRHGDDYFQGYLWKNFSREWPNPLIYTVGKSNPARDWNYAHGAYIKDEKCQKWTWEVRFNIQRIAEEGNARLVIAWAGSERGKVHVALNGVNIAVATPPVSGGNALLRQAIHAKYSFSNIDFPVSRLKTGTNVLSLIQLRDGGAAHHVMYDYLALELP